MPGRSTARSQMTSWRGRLAPAVLILAALGGSSLFLGCIENRPAAPSDSAALGVTIVFPETSPGAGASATSGVATGAVESTDSGLASSPAGGASISLTEIRARALELGDANIVRDEDVAALAPTQRRFELTLNVPPAPYYRVEVEARGTRETNGTVSEFGILYSGDGFAMDVSDNVEQEVEVILENRVPELSGSLEGPNLTLSWTPISQIARYRLRETSQGTVRETALAGTDTTISVGSQTRSYRVRAELENGTAAAYSEEYETALGSEGDLRVTVVDAETGLVLSGARVMILGRSASTNNQGIVEFAGLPAGSAPLVVDMDSYIQGTTNVTIVAGAIVTTRVALSRPLDGGYRFILTWGATPRDLDSHLVTPLIQGQVYEVYFLDPGSETEAPFAHLDQDATNGDGPETISIFQTFDGIYKFFVFNFSGQDDGDAPLAGSGAQVTLIRGNEIINSVVVPDTGTGTYWNVLTLEPRTQTVVVLNEISEAPPGLVDPAIRRKSR